MRRIPLVLAAWSLFVWAVRIGNAGADLGPVLLSLTFVLLAIAVLVSRGDAWPTRLLAGWTVAVWAVRIVDILLLSDHGAGFKVVHAALGAVSIALAVASAASVSRSPRPTPG